MFVAEPTTNQVKMSRHGYKQKSLHTGESSVPSELFLNGRLRTGEFSGVDWFRHGMSH